MVQSPAKQFPRFGGRLTAAAAVFALVQIFDMTVKEI